MPFGGTGADAGDTWRDHAIANPCEGDAFPYGVSVFQELTPDGHILGCYTERVSKERGNAVWFFTLKSLAAHGK